MKDTLRPLATLDFPESELVFALEYAAGTDREPVIAALENGLTRFGYAPRVIGMSGFLPHYSLRARLVDAPEHERIASRMNAGQ